MGAKMGKEAGCMSILQFEPIHKGGAAETGATGGTNGWKKSPSYSPAANGNADADTTGVNGEEREKGTGCFDCVMRRRPQLDTDIDAERDAKLEAYLVKRSSAGALPGDAGGDGVSQNAEELATLAPASPLPSWRDDAGVVISDSSADDEAESRSDEDLAAVTSAISRKASREAHEIDTRGDGDSSNDDDEQSKRARTVHFNCSSTDIDTQTQQPLSERANADTHAQVVDDDVQVVVGTNGDDPASQTQYRSSSSLMRRKATPFPGAKRRPQRKRTMDRFFSTRTDGDYISCDADDENDADDVEDIDALFPISAKGSGNMKNTTSNNNGEEARDTLAPAQEKLTDDIVTVELSEFGDSEYGGSVFGEDDMDADIGDETNGRAMTVSSFGSGAGSFKSRKLTPYPGERPKRTSSKGLMPRRSSKLSFKSGSATINIHENEYDELESMLERVTGDSTANVDDEDDNVDNIVMPDTPPSISTMACIEEDDNDDEVHAAVTNKRKVFLRNFTSASLKRYVESRALCMRRFFPTTAAPSRYGFKLPSP